ncbi:hypothetical protein GCM10010885_19210 [Alicyclobacillus cellulosilyticus]|uniref:PNPLA domain-containing protein n=1 Tax=Alicyclobacillus cellulosilyticus TaxID=1003997 RepID=A0A917NLG8_9BACL|nr:patatin-like phospholipase family protein [Alicyclobacillus cellulosilyticus]GGJ10178.1 hypothetical protein GCM10010885_19210 [Alicyclobacillus cellulosilyticus]
MRIGIALSGGTLKAAAHVGVLAALAELGVHPDCVAGTSAGSLVAALYAHGYSADELKRLVDWFPGPRLLDFGFPILSSAWSLLLAAAGRRPRRLPNGLVRGNRLAAYIAELLRGRTPVLPFYIIATDLRTGSPVTFTNDIAAIARGIACPVQDVTAAVLGSCSLPGLLTPVEMGSWLLVDGAFRHYVPVHVLRQVGCQKLLAVNLHHLDMDWEPQTFIDVLVRSFEILLKESIENDVDGPDLFVLEPNVHATWWSFREVPRFVAEGEREVRARRSQLTVFLRTPPRRGPRVVFHALPETGSDQRIHTSTDLS